MEFIEESEDKQELKRAIATKIYLEGCTLKETSDQLGVSFQFVDKWKNNYLKEGVQSLKLGYQGSSGYLSIQERLNVIHWVNQQSCCTLKKLKEHIACYYGVRFQSSQSYYQIFKEARFSFKKSQKVNPKRKAQHVAAKRHALKKSVASTDCRNTGKKAAFLFSG
jgi:putative transposase